MENIFNNRHDVDEVDKVNMDDLYEKKQQSDWDTSSSRKKTVTCQQLGKFLTCF